MKKLSISENRPLRVAGVSFDHMHMGDLLRQAMEHPEVEIVGLCEDNPANRDAVENTLARLKLSQDLVFTDCASCLGSTQPDLVILCAATARHAEYAERIARHPVHLLVEKPFAANLADADRMIEAMRQSGHQLAINWPLAWYPPHLTTKRLITEGAIGEPYEVHYYDGNRGPTRHLAGKEEIPEEEAIRRMQTTWWYRKEEGGGSLLDYLGYGVTLGTWFFDGKAPREVNATTWGRAGLAVDEQSVTVCRYESGLSTFQTRWGTFSDPWTHQPQPKCGFVIVGSEGTLSSYDYADTVRLQTLDEPAGVDLPVDQPPPEMSGPLAHMVPYLRGEIPLHGPLTMEICRIGQRIVDAAVESAQSGRPISL